MYNKDCNKINILCVLLYCSRLQIILYGIYINSLMIYLGYGTVINSRNKFVWALYKNS